MSFYNFLTVLRGCFTPISLIHLSLLLSSPPSSFLFLLSFLSPFFSFFPPFSSLFYLSMQIFGAATAAMPHRFRRAWLYRYSDLVVRNSSYHDYHQFDYLTQLWYCTLITDALLATHRGITLRFAIMAARAGWFSSWISLGITSAQTWLWGIHLTMTTTSLTT